MALIYNDPQHWRERAAEARALAASMADAKARKAMIEIAEKYDRLAARALGRIAEQLKPTAKPEEPPRAVDGPLSGGSFE